MCSSSDRYDLPSNYYHTYETSIQTLEDFEVRKVQIAALAARSGLNFYWRGQADARWGVHSSLHRLIAGNRGVALAMVKDAEVVAVERRIISEAREWIRPSIGARLTTVDLLARLQHHGVPTRLLDFSKDALVALFFAVATHKDSDGRIVIAAARDFVDDGFKNSFNVPWASRQQTRPKGWGNTLVALADHEDFLRITRQKGVFLTGGTPSTGVQRRLSDGHLMGARHVRESMSVPLALHGWVQAEAAVENRSPRGRRPTVASALTLRVPASAKQPLMRRLTKNGYSYEALFPDIGGFIQYSGIVPPLGSGHGTGKPWSGGRPSWPGSSSESDGVGNA